MKKRVKCHEEQLATLEALAESDMSKFLAEAQRLKETMAKVKTATVDRQKHVDRAEQEYSKFLEKWERGINGKS